MWRRAEEASPYEQAFTALVHRQSRFVFRVAYSVLRNSAEAEDIGQEAFLKLYRSRTWQDAADERAFLARVVWRLAIDRAQALRRPHAKLAPAESQSPEQAVSDADATATLHRWIEALPNELRYPLVLSTVDELTSEEIAKILAIPSGTVRSRLNRGRELLKQKMAATMTRRT